MTVWVSWDESKMIVLLFQRTRSHSSGEVFCRVPGHLATKPSRHRRTGHQELCIFNTFRKDKSMMTYKPRGRRYSGFQETGMIEWEKKSKHKKSLGLLTKPKISGKKINPRALKKAAKQVWLCFIRKTLRPSGTLLWVFRLFWTPPKNSFLNQTTQKNTC